MRPFTAAGVGLVLVVVDFRTGSIDLAPDAVGWALVVFAFLRLATPPLALLAGAGLLCSLAEFWLPFHHRTVESFAVDPLSGEAMIVEVEVVQYDAVTGVRFGLIGLSVVILGTVLWAIVRIVRERAQPYHDERTIKRATVLGGASIATWVLPHLVVMAATALGDGRYDAVWNDPAWRVELIGTVVVVAFVAVLVANAREPWALPPGVRRLGNWEGMTTDPDG